MRKKWTTRLAIVALTAATLTGVALAAGSQGSREDPLVTLSYLNEVAIPDILKQVDEKIEAREGTGSAQASFQTVDLAAGKTLRLTAGSQLLPRSGDLTTTDAFTDLTDGAVLAGKSLTANHLYLATADGQSVTAGAACTVLVLGGYEVK